MLHLLQLPWRSPLFILLLWEVDVERDHGNVEPVVVEAVLWFHTMGSVEHLDEVPQLQRFFGISTKLANPFEYDPMVHFA